MDFLRKGAQAAKKLGNQLMEAVDGDADHAGTHSGRAEKEPIPDERKDDSKGDVFDDKETASNSKLGSSGSLEDAEFESAVKHFMAVNGNLKQVGVRAQSWVQSIKAQSSCGLAVGTASLDASRLEFEEEPTWIQAAEKLNDMAQLLDTKFATQLCSLLQRDILDPISVELETNKDTKSLVESGRSGRLTTTQIDEAVSKLHEIMRRRKILLAQCITVLGSHQYNYYVRLAEQFQSIQPTVVDCKKRIADMTTASKTQAQRGSQEGSSSPIATSRPVPKAAEAAPNPSPAQPEPKPPVVEGDLLGMFGESPSGSQAAKVPAPVSVAKSSDTSGREADLLGGQPSKPAAKPANKGDLLGDLFSSPVQGVRSARQAPATGSPVPRAAADPLAEFLGTSAGPAKSAQPDFFGGGAQEMGPARVNGDDEVTKVVQRPRPRGPNDFKGTGTSREALKEQFEAHVENKAAAAAAEIRKLDEEKKKYEDLKFQMADSLDQRVTMWAGPKHTRKNLRAMLSTFDMVLWDEAKAKWKPVGLHELLMPDQVKKIHRKAILLVHPDKVSGASMESKFLAEQVHAVLHEALEVFRKQENC